MARTISGLQSHIVGPVTPACIMLHCQKVFQLAHSIPVAGHMERDRTLQRIQQRFYWPSLFWDVEAYCHSQLSRVSEARQQWASLFERVAIVNGVLVDDFLLDTGCLFGGLEFLSIQYPASSIQLHIIQCAHGETYHCISICRSIAL